jgi:hypothetical protein
VSDVYYLLCEVIISVSHQKQCEQVFKMTKDKKNIFFFFIIINIDGQQFCQYQQNKVRYEKTTD